MKHELATLQHNRHFFFSMDEKITRRDLLLQQITASPYNVVAWTAFLADALASQDEELIRSTYDQLLAAFPTSVKYWMDYIDFESRCDRLDLVEGLYAQCLPTLPHVALWTKYVQHVRSSKSAQNMDNQVLIDAYDVCVQNVGLDRNAGHLWQEYVDLIRSQDADYAVEEQRRMDMMRKLFKRCCSIPLANIEALWREYDTFENTLNRLTAKKFLAELSPVYTTARAATRELKTMLVRCHNKDEDLPVPPTWTDVDQERVHAWRRYIEWEKTDPLKLEDGGYARVAFAYKVALLQLRHYPQVWYEAAHYQLASGKQTEATSLLQSGCVANPTSCLLYFALAELVETEPEPKTQLLESIFDELLEHVQHEMDRHTKHFDDQVALLQPPETTDLTESAQTNTHVMDGDIKEEIRQRERIFTREKGLIDQERKRIMDQLALKSSLAWTTYMNAIRRTQGIKAARGIFRNARKSPHLTYHVYIASAYMEYHCSKDAALAVRVFQAGLKFYQDAPFVSAYLTFLLRINDDTNARALFERMISNYSPQEAQSIWTMFLDYEGKFGELAGISSIEKRMTAIYPEPSVHRFMQRHTFTNVNIIQQLELGIQDRPAHSNTVDIPTDDDHPFALEDSDPSTRTLDLTPVRTSKYTRPNLVQWHKFQPPSIKPTTATLSTLQLPSGPALSKELVSFLLVLPPAHLCKDLYINTDDLLGVLHGVRNGMVPSKRRFDEYG
jgi:cleavage stimulation factor subunit 3